MRNKLVAALCFAALVTGCGIKIPTGYRPSESMVPNASLVEIAVNDRNAPIEISGPGLNGGQVSTADLNGVVIVNAWASWCAPCREEWPILAQIQTENPTVNLLGLNEADDAEAAADFLASQAGEWPHITDPNQSIAAEADVVQGSYLPGTIVLDRQHRVAAKFIGPVNKSDLQRIVTQLLAE